MAGNIVTTLFAKPGNKPGEMIGTYQRSIVFLPKGVNDGEEVRIELIPIREDSRGNMMYRGEPAKNIVVEGWRENKDGTVTLCRVTINWKLEDIQIYELETRQKKIYEGSPTVESNSEIRWGSNLATTKLEIIKQTFIPQMQEEFPAGKKWPNGFDAKELPKKDGGKIVESFAIESIEAAGTHFAGTQDWVQNRLRLSYSGEPTLYVQLKLGYSEGEFMNTPSKKFEDLPRWIQDHIAKPYPVCSCGRARIDTPAKKTRCEVCAAETAKVETVHKYLPVQKRVDLARIAALCSQAALEGGAWEGENGETLAIAITGHVPPESLQSWRGFGWYYNTAEGIFASRFPPEAMMILANLGTATGEGLVTLSCWLTVYHQASRCADDFYAKTQFKHETTEAKPEEYVLTNGSVAVFLRGTEDARHTAVAAKTAAESTPEISGAPSFQPAFDAMNRHDYAQAAELYAKAKKESEAAVAKRIEDGRMNRIDMRGWQQASPQSKPTPPAVPAGVEVVQRKPISSEPQEQGIGTFFLETSPRHFQCGKCRTVQKMGDVEWNMYRNNLYIEMTCTSASCGAQGAVRRDQNTPPTTKKPVAPAPKAEPPRSIGNLRVPDAWKTKKR